MSSSEPNADNFLAENAKINNQSLPPAPPPSEPPAQNNNSSSVLEAGIKLSTSLTPQPSPPETSDPSHEEHQYLNLIRSILTQGEYRPDRTGTGTLSLFNPPTLRFTLSKPDPSPNNPTSHINILPLLTTKRVFTRAVIAELLWFIKGSTNAKDLSSQGVHIWDGNGSRSFLDNLGPPQSLREEGDLGPVYGFQWRHFGAEYKDCHADYTGQGVDQIKEIIYKLRHTPYDRRILLSAWNVAALGEMALPPCHLLAQFYVSYPDALRGKEAWRAWKEQQEHQSTSSGTTNGTHRTRGRLSCTLYQRSADTGLGVPFNIASYALLTHMLAYACDLVPGTFNMVLGDAHVYVDHIDALKGQIERAPREFPELRINRDDAGRENVDGWKLEDFEVVGYKPHAGVKMKMSV
ncbi:Thymidylate synthase [Knufia fluminis]|uniref:thymidylate synthase n=1 Tax=Knufia fluminis TaxID=191047 RepID=A0AAN8ERP1_9EURO|nr:Thymidylate synthase [Knufia fluminis]